MTGGGISQVLVIIVLIILPLIFAITLHEAAHGWMAKKLGDKTAYLMGRVSLNPMRHIDWFGTIVLPLVMIIFSMVYSGMPFLFGWAKPVPVNWSNLKNLRRDKALVAFAGPFSNVLMAIFWAAIAKISVDAISGGGVGFFHEAGKYFYLVGRYGVMINMVLFFLNLIPIPPLDGSRIVSAVIPRRWCYYYDRIEPYGIWILLGLIILGGLRYILFPPVSWSVQAILNMFGLA